MKIQSRCLRFKGFALIITLTLMVLLTLIVVGLLSLSSVSLRASAGGMAMATARSNARLALMMALGELQRSAGPDQRVTARADILDEKIANPRITGVWESSEIKATAPPQADTYKIATKNAKFKAWLVSSPDPVASRTADFAQTAQDSPVTLWGKGSLGAKAPAASHVDAAKVPLGSSSAPGALAWAALDEGLKARVNTPYVDGAASVGAKTMQLGAGECPGVEFIGGLNKLERGMFNKDKPQFATIEKGITRLNYGLAAQDLAKIAPEDLQALTHDITTQSLGLFTNTAHGGFKQDYQLLTNATSLPVAYQGKGVYASRLGLNPNQVPSDPTWDSLFQFTRLYRDKVTSAAGVPYLKSQVPANWVAATTGSSGLTVNLKPANGLVLMPTIVKVQVIFSLIGRDLYDYPGPAKPTDPMPIVPDDAPGFHGPQCDRFRGTKYKYDLHVLYTPSIILHNPYNVALEFYDMHVEFVHTPFALQIFRNGIAQSTGLVPVETMYADNMSGSSPKVFGIDLKTKSSAGTADSPTFRLLPGEVKLFTPYIDPTRTYRQEFTDGRLTWDIYVNQGVGTTQITAIPGWRGDGIGYGCDWVTGALPTEGAGSDATPSLGHWQSCLGLARDDQINVEFAPLSVPEFSNNKFVVRVTGRPGSMTADPVVVNAIEINYQSPTGLQDYVMGKGKTVRYPKTGSVQGIDLVNHASTPVASLTRVKPFALMTVQAKTTSGGKDASGEDGRLATKPWCFGHAVVGGSTQKIPTEHGASASHEFDLVRLDNGTANLMQVDGQDRSNYMSGYTALNGTKFGVLYDVPLAPVQNFATLNGANPGGSSGYLPRFAQPIGNSWAHPLISAGKLMEVRSDANYLDHSYLLNLAFYDNFYFSGLADQSGPFCSPAKSTASLASDFAAGKPLGDPRLLLHRPNTRPASELATDLAKADAYTRIAAWQMMEGAFNINSTSVPAWKAMLASIHDSQSLYNHLNKTAKPPTSAITDLTAVKKEAARISRLRLPVSTSAADGADPSDGYWLGPREYTDYQLQALAENIVKQVRLRGPFLSMAEFVNRRLTTDDTAQRGALQQAIDDANVNQGLAVAANAGFEIPANAVANYKYLNPAAGTGSSYQGAPGCLSQADILNVLGNAATARSDTFTIRGYGEARDDKGKILASATCEAVVQRYPEWVDPTDPVETAPTDLKSVANKSFGRRFSITSLRWLNSDEI